MTKQPTITLKRIATRTIGAVMVAATVFAAAQPAQAVTTKTAPSFFHSVEVRSADITPFRKWNAVLDRYATETVAADWEAFLESVSGLGKWRQLVAVNQFMNARRYVDDDSNWGVKDYWQTPTEFMSRSGDCEDFAIAKFMSLKRLGWTDDELRIVAVKDLRKNIGHAILVVAFDGKTWILDNQIKTVTSTADVSHYEPVYSINETYWWRHRV